MNERCEVEWIPPPGLDTGQARVNTYHRPERLLRSDGPEPLGDNTDGAAEKGQDARPADDPGEPGGPAPPNDQAA